MLIPLRQCEDPAVHGTKAVQLARLARAGLPVPGGVVIPATLPDDQVAAVTRRVLAWAASQRARHGLIIRSSAPAEDGIRASFAGLYCSHFTCARPPDLQAAVRAVRASGTEAMVREYAQVSQVDAPPDVAVIIQAAVRSCSAGILAGQIREGIWHDWQIEAVHGSAVPLASGQASGEIHRLGREPIPAALPEIVLPGTPQELRLPPGEWIMVDDRDGVQHRVKIRTSAGGLVTVWQPPSWRLRAILPGGDAARLLDLAAAAADAIDANDIDIEWAITPRGRPCLLQARPLTRPLPRAQEAGRKGTDPAGWQGIPASPGLGSGPSLQLGHSASSADGMVVICGNLGLGAATMLLQRPAAVAATTGGSLSHAAIVARELGIPCVTGLPKQLRDLPDGTILTVDGLAGTVSAGHNIGAMQVGLDTDATGAVVVAWPSSEADEDGRAATVMLLEPGTSWESATSFLAGSAAPVGVLQLGRAPLPALPAGCEEHYLPGIGRLAWPVAAGWVPPALLVLDGATPIWRRVIGEAQPSSDPCR